jgi:hypothetical protein
LSAAARKYTDQTLKKLFGLAGNQCAFMDCNESLVNRNNAKNSNVCHIEAASSGGQRYNPNMTNIERADYENLILLCVQHHDETNDINVYTVSALKEMKLNHEDHHLNQKIKKYPSMLTNAINAIADIQLDKPKVAETLAIYDINEKIQHNALKTNVALLQTYKVYHQKINSLYDELERQGSLRKERLLDNINSIYIEVLGKHVLDTLNPIEVIREKSDEIFNDVYDVLCIHMEGSAHWAEDVYLAVRLIMVDAFMRCKILEEPPTLP